MDVRMELEGKPVLMDAEGPLDTPITGDVRVKVEADTTVAWLVAYMPANEVSPARARAALDALLQDTGISHDSSAELRNPISRLDSSS